MLDLFHIALSFAETRCRWLLSPPTKALATAPFPSRTVGRFPEAPISFSTRKASFPTANDHDRTTSGPRLVMSQWPSSTGAQCRSRSDSRSITPRHMGTSRCQRNMAIERDLGQSGRTASVDVTDARWKIRLAWAVPDSVALHSPPRRRQDRRVRARSYQVSSPRGIAAARLEAG
jgi:hypothetical protein